MARNLADRAGYFMDCGAEYAQYRPIFPAELSALLANLAPSHRLALDVGCGTGQFSLLLARHFERVRATDVSADQIAHAKPHPKIEYFHESAESMSADNGTAALVVAAQSVHWFNLPNFYSEVRRVAVPQGILALISYDIPAIDGGANERYQYFYWHELAPYWPPERSHVVNGYADLDFPFKELDVPKSAILCNWDLGSFIGYIRIWSATRKAVEADCDGLVDRFEEDMKALWGPPEVQRQISWPINMRVGRL